MGNAILWIIVGIIAIVGGIFALLNPFAATLAATAIAAWVFIFVGVIQVFAAFREEGTGAKIWMILMGVLAVVLGVWILGRPLAGVIALTTVVAVMFLIFGIIKVVMAFSLEDRSFFWLILISGAVSVILAVMIFSNFPYSATVVLGVLLGVNLISDGASLTAMGISMRRAANEAA